MIGSTLSQAVNGYTPPRALQLFERVEEGLAALPGTSSVTGSWVRLLSGMEVDYGYLRSVDNQVIDPELMLNTGINKIGPAYFRTRGIPLLAGRGSARRLQTAWPHAVSALKRDRHAALVRRSSISHGERLQSPAQRGVDCVADVETRPLPNNVCGFLLNASLKKKAVRAT